MNKVLVIAAHPDDEILGVGGTIAKHVKNGDECYGVILGEGMTSRFSQRDKADFNQVELLHQDTYSAAKIIGYKQIFLENLPDNRFDSVDLLHIIKIIEKYIDEINPQIIYTHFKGDLNIDHRKTFEAVLTATRPIGEYCVKEIYCFETVSATEWNFQSSDYFKPNYFVDISDTLDIKLNAIQLYKSEMREFPFPRSVENLKYCAKRWGSVTGTNSAEAFEVIRIIK